VDTCTAERRSQIMAGIGSAGNRTTELALLAHFRNRGIVGWRRHYQVSGTPDFAFPKSKIAVFVDGCFWHGCSTHCRLPRTNADYWMNKISRNVRRDARVGRELRRKGWVVIRIWEHELKGGAPLSRKLTRLAHLILTDRP
jgi:DNA mismatch endonuclease (patch repair protein)